MSLVTQNAAIDLDLDINEKHDLWISDVVEIKNPAIESSEFAYQVRGAAFTLLTDTPQPNLDASLLPLRPPISYKSTMTALGRPQIMCVGMAFDINTVLKFRHIVRYGRNSSPSPTLLGRGVPMPCIFAHQNPIWPQTP